MISYVQILVDIDMAPWSSLEGCCVIETGKGMLQIFKNITSRTAIPPSVNQYPSMTDGYPYRWSIKFLS